MSEAPRKPKVVVVVNGGPDHEEKVSTVRGCVTDAGVDAVFASALSDLEALVGRGECDVAVVDLSFRGAGAQVARIAKGAARPPLLASMQLFRGATGKPPPWATCHIVYGHAEQFAEEVRELANRWEA